MLTAAQCRAKATAALVNADEAPNEVIRQLFVSHAHEWIELSRAAEAQDRLSADLSGARNNSTGAGRSADELNPETDGGIGTEAGTERRRRRRRRAAVSAFDIGTSVRGSTSSGAPKGRGAVMPRYKFSLSEDHNEWNGEAKELPDVQAAKCVAIKMIADTLCEHPQAFWEAETHQVTVSDENCLTLFIVDITTTTAPAILPMFQSRRAGV